MQTTYETMVLEAENPEMARKVLDALEEHVGREQAITRRDLVMLVHGLSGTWGASERQDRVVRLAISNLQELGAPILSNSGGGGYYLAENREEIFEYVSEILSRIAKLKRKAKILRGAAYGMGREQ